MTDHLPECPMKPITEAPVDFHQVFPDCICDRLLACEQRVQVHALQQAKAREANGITWAIAHKRALDAAEAALANIQGPLYSVRNSGDAQQGWDAHNRHAVAAIRALGEDKP